MAKLSPKALKLRAHDHEDLVRLSSLMQDAIVAPKDMRFDAKAKRFVLATNRFRWEASRGVLGLPKRPTRVRSIVRFDYVESVQSRGLNTSDDIPLNLLAITVQSDAPGERIVLSFSGACDIALQCETVDATLDDVSAPWAANVAPKHQV
ncbi:MAG: DUF2948 family protein [Pseudomonadota bacterium]